MKFFKNIIVVSIIALVVSSQVSAFSFFNQEPKDPRKELEARISLLQKKQIDKPHDPLINYNLGVALYRAGKFDQAAKILNVLSKEKGTM